MGFVLALIVALLWSVHGVGQQPLPANPSSFGGIGLDVEHPQDMVLLVGHDLSNPLPGLLAPGDSTIDRRSGADTGDVLPILGTVEGPQVRTAAIQTVAVDMVALATVAGSQTQQFTMQQSTDSSPILSRLPDGVPVFVWVPAPLTYPLSISSINNDVQPNGTALLTEQNLRGQAVGADFGDGSQAWSTRFSTDGRAVIPGVLIARAAHDLTAASIAPQGDPKLRAAGLTGVAAGVRAEQSLARVDRAGTGHEVGPALSADARNGTLRLHLDSPPGVTPRAVSAAPGYLRASILPRVEAL